VWGTEEGNHALAAFLDAFENVWHGFDLGTMDGFWAPLHSGGAVIKTEQPSKPKLACLLGRHKPFVAMMHTTELLERDNPTGSGCVSRAALRTILV
jgi:hypothetical protein